MVIEDYSLQTIGHHRGCHMRRCTGEPAALARGSFDRAVLRKPLVRWLRWSMGVERLLCCWRREVEALGTIEYVEGWQLLLELRSRFPLRFEPQPALAPPLRR
jgi:hypothetical protein